MTLATTQNRIAYSGNGSTTDFAFPYKFLQDADLVVILRDASGVEVTKVLTTDYTVSGEGEDEGGTVTMLTAPATGESLTILREPEETQDLDLVENDPMPAEEVEERLDKGMMVQQRALDKINRALRLTDGLAETFDTELPTVLTPGTLLGVNEDGDGFALFATTELQFNDSVINVADYGAVGDGSTDDAVALTAAIAAAISTGKTLYGVPGKTYRIQSNVNFRFVAVDFSKSSILVVGTAIRAIIGGNAGSAINPPQRFYEITRSGGENANPTVRCIGAKGQVIRIDYVDYMDLYADTSTGHNATDYSIAYSTFHLNYCRKLVLTNNASTDGSSVQWINENTFHLKRTEEVLIEGTYGHNHNIFHTGTFEGAAADITISNGVANLFYNVRFEGASAEVEFGEDCYDNKVICSWQSNENVIAQIVAPATVTDPSGRNFCQFEHHSMQRRLSIVDVNPNTCETYTNNTGGARANFTSIKGVDVQRKGIETFQRNSFAQVFECPFIPVVPGDTIKFNADAVLFRPQVQLFDANRNLMTEGTYPSIADYLSCFAGLAWNNSTDQYEQSANTDDQKCTVLSSDVKYIKFNLIMGNSVGTTTFTRFGIELICKTWSADALGRAMGNKYQMASVAASPTRGFAREKGITVNDIAGSSTFYTCVFSLDTKSTVAKVATDTTITVATVTGITSGDIVGLELDDGTTHWTTVNGAPAGSVVTLTDALPSAAAANNRVVFNRWA